MGLALFGMKLCTVYVLLLHRCSEPPMMIARADYMLLPVRFCIVGVNEIEIGRIGNALEEQALSRLREGVPSHVRDRAILGKLYNVARYETKTIRVVVFAAVMRGIRNFPNFA